MAGQPDGARAQHRRVTTAVANGDLSKKITVDVRGEILDLKNTINGMVDQLNAFAGEVTRVRARSARKVAWAARPTCWAPPAPGKTSPITSTSSPPTSRPRCEHRRSHLRGAKGRPLQKDHGGGQGEVLELKNTINVMVDQLNAFASESPASPGGRYRRQSGRPGAGQGRGGT